MEALANRILRAHKNRRENVADDFRHVFIVVPQKPEFHGDLDGKNYNLRVDTKEKLKSVIPSYIEKTILREMTRWTYCTLFRGNNSLKRRLIRAGGMLTVTCSALYSILHAVPESEVFQYFSVFGLRTHDVLQNEEGKSLVHRGLALIEDEKSYAHCCR